MTLFMTDMEALSVEVHDFVEKKNTLTPGQKEAITYLVGGPQTALRIGIWVCTPGRFKVRRETTEICRLVSGRATLRDSEGLDKALSLGETFMLPAGWVGEWDVQENVRKIFIVHAD